jgi:excisionase family DNA binding protein
MSCATSAKSQAEAINGSSSDEDEHDVLDVRGAMQLLMLGRSAVYDACTRGEIPHRRIGKLIRFSRAALLRWLAGTR